MPNSNDAIAEAQAEDETITANALNDERNGNGYKQNDKDFKFVCINNNDNVVVNEPIPPEPEPITCEECIEKFLTLSQIITLNQLFERSDLGLEVLCTSSTPVITEEFLRDRLVIVGVQEETINNLIACLLEAGIVLP